VLFGVDRALAGELRLDGQTIALRTPRDAIDRGIFLVPEDRKRFGLVLDQSVNENISLPNLISFASGLLIRAAAERRNALEQKAALDIRTASVDTLVGTLSGGNQQKVVLAKWLSMKPRVVIFDEPTRGIDVGSKSEIYKLMRGLSDAGVAVLMISSDMEEVIGVSDRIAVMREGRIAGFLARNEFSEENVMRLAVGRRDLQEAEAVSA
jgi:ribose transport system ATP-binding protein